MVYYYKLNIHFIEKMKVFAAIALASVSAVKLTESPDDGFRFKA
tara:strand:- start:496 stop:627 length:132 start_codon:yes stop_codon:yes gene_type:complete